MEQINNSILEILSKDIRTQADYARDKYIEAEGNIFNKDGNTIQQYFTAGNYVYPENRQAPEGIEQINGIKYHSFERYDRFPEQPDTGPKPMTKVAALIRGHFTQFSPILDDYIRPKASTDAIMKDFLLTQKTVTPITPEREDRIIRLIKTILNAKPYQPIHYCDTRFYPADYNKKADYYHLHNDVRKEGAKTSRLSTSTGPTKKSHFINEHLGRDRSVVHNIKEYGYPFTPDKSNADTNRSKLDHWFKTHPTELLTRLHISRREKPKVRPVYNAPMVYLRMEYMLFTPLLAQARTKECAIAYGLETIRGGMAAVNRIATEYDSYIMYDWSKFDHTIPFPIIDAFFQKYIKSLICINDGYAPIKNYRTHNVHFRNQLRNKGPAVKANAQLKFSNKMSNLINFVNKWYKEMIFVSPDGFAYRRKHAGVPSGILMTQYIDSFANLYVMLDGMIEMGFTDKMILDIKYFIMGDDNVMFIKDETLNPRQANQFYDNFISYAEQRWHMTINKEKSSFTRNRNMIEFLGYRNSFGFPIKDTEKLVAQLAFPERHATPVDMVSRCIGLAYAECGINFQVYQLLKETHKIYLNQVKDEELNELKAEIASLPGVFSAQPDIMEQFTINPKVFPSFTGIHNLVARHAGYLKVEPLWNRKYFMNEPFVTKEFINVRTVLDGDRLSKHRISIDK